MNCSLPAAFSMICMNVLYVENNCRHWYNNKTVSIDLKNDGKSIPTRLLLLPLSALLYNGIIYESRYYISIYIISETRTSSYFFRIKSARNLIVFNIIL